MLIDCSAIGEGADLRLTAANVSKCETFDPTKNTPKGLETVFLDQKHLFICTCPKSPQQLTKRWAGGRGGRYYRKNYRQPINQHFYNLSADYRYRKK